MMIDLIVANDFDNENPDMGKPSTIKDNILPITDFVSNKNPYEFDRKWTQKFFRCRRCKTRYELFVPFDFHEDGIYCPVCKESKTCKEKGG